MICWELYVEEPIESVGVHCSPCFIRQEGNHEVIVVRRTRFPVKRDGRRIISMLIINA